MRDKDTIPTVRIAPGVQAELDADPEKALAIKRFTEAALNALQAVKDGRHPDFGAAMKALGYECAPVEVEDEDDDEQG